METTIVLGFRVLKPSYTGSLSEGQNCIESVGRFCSYGSTCRTLSEVSIIPVLGRSEYKCYSEGIYGDCVEISWGST